MSPLDALLRAVRRRARWADAAYGLVRFGLPSALLIASAGVVALRLGVAPPEILWCTLLPLPALLGWAWLRPRPLRTLARRVDAHYGLHDRLGAALEFRTRRPASPDPRTDALVDLITAEADARARTLDPRPVVRVHLPGPHRIDAVALLVLAAAVVVPQRRAARLEAQLERPEFVTRRDKVQVDLALAEPLRRNLAELRGQEDVAARTAEAILELLERLERGELDRAAAYAALEDLERALAEAEAELERREEDPATLQEAIERLAATLEQHEITAEAGSALAQGRESDSEAAWDDAAAAAEADAAAERQLERALGDAERSLGQSAGQSSDTSRQLGEAERRLRQAERTPSQESPEERERRLKQLQRRVEELKRQAEREEAARRRLEELRRNAEQAAKERQNRRGAVEKLSRGASEASRRARGAQRLRQARDGLEEAKTVVRRAGAPKDGDTRRRQQYARFREAASGADKPKSERGKPTLLIESELGDGPPMGEPQPGDDAGQGDGGEASDDALASDEPGGQDEGNDASPGADGSLPGRGDEAGDGQTDPLGDPRSKGVRLRDVHVQAKAGRGVSRAEVIRESSQRGFATEAYRDVYTSYRAFAQSAMDNETLPAAQRRAVKRYYQLIAPRL